MAAARHLAEAGPTPGDSLAESLGMTPDRFWAVINHPWFTITGRGWVLTEQGKVEGLTT